MRENDFIAPSATIDPAVDSQTTVDSSFRLIVVASLRNKQLTRGSHSRIESDPRRRRNTSIALEEVRRGLVRFTLRPGKTSNGGGAVLDMAESE